MDRECAEKIILEYSKTIFGFALKRCTNIQDAEDLSQEIVMKAFRALLMNDDVQDYGKFIRTIAHHTLANYYRDRSRQFVNVPIHDMAELLSNSVDIEEGMIENETVFRLQREIAYLSKLQRKIVVAYYYENKKQTEIAAELNISLGTVKWHLFDAKKELKRGMETMRTSSELKFNPIQFAVCGTNGSVGTKGSNRNFFRSALSQNIVYVVWKEPKAINEIADALGVSSVYVESEAEYLEKYGFLTKRGNRYLCNILLEEPTEEINRLHDEMYEKAAKIFANELYDKLIESDILNCDILFGGYTGQLSLKTDDARDKNFFLWALIPYIAAQSGEDYYRSSARISFEEVATIRLDGGQNICYAEVWAPGVKPVKYADSMKTFWSGPCWNVHNDMMLWQIDSEWSEKRIDENYEQRVKHDLSLLSHYQEDPTVLSTADYAYLVERGYLKTVGEPDEYFKAAMQCVQIGDGTTNAKLLEMGDEIREKYKEAFEALKVPYVNAVLRNTPEHLRKMRSYGLQYIFYVDGWFILHCLKELVGNGKLKLPTKEQKQALTTIIISDLQ